MTVRIGSLARDRGFAHDRLQRGVDPGREGGRLGRWRPTLGTDPEVVRRLHGLQVPMILGPTAVGKSRVAIEVARALGGEVVVCDSRQVYRGLEVVSNQPRPEERREVRHHLVGTVDPRHAFNVFQFVEAAHVAMVEIVGRGHVPVVEGGTMLWADALARGFSLGDVPPRPERRAELERLTVTELAALARRLDPDLDIDLRNPVRLIRAIEVLEVAGPPLSRLRRRHPPPWKPVKIGLTVDLATLDRRIEERVREQMDRGLIEEVAMALAAGVPPDAPALTGIGCLEARAHLEGCCSREEVARAIIRADRRYARRQLRWLRRDPEVRWFDATTDPLPGILEYLRERIR
jgi:tRNA dimethylallyltransferase